MPIDPKPNESQNDFMARCIRTEVNAGKGEKQAVAICIQAYQNRKNK